MKIKITTAFLIASIYSANAATILPLTFNTGTSSASAFGFSNATALTDDGFAYDPDNPTAILPAQNFNGVGATNNGFHGNEANNTDVTLNFDLATAHTITAPESVFVIDVYGRLNSEVETDRDNDFDVVLLNGATTVATITGLGIPDTGVAHARATFDSLTVGQNITAVRIIGHDTGDAANFFSLAEVEAATIAPVLVPEPSSTALLGLGGLALILRRRK